MLLDSKKRTVYNVDPLDLVADKKMTMRGNFEDYLMRKERTKFAYKHIVQPKGSPYSTTIHIDVRIPHGQRVLYVPGTLETLKFGWMQILALLIPLLWIHDAMVRSPEPHFKLIEVQAKQGSASLSDCAHGLELAGVHASLLWWTRLSCKQYSHRNWLNRRELHRQRFQLGLYWLLTLVLVEELRQDLYNAQKLGLGSLRLDRLTEHNHRLEAPINEGQHDLPPRRSLILGRQAKMEIHKELARLFPGLLVITLERDPPKAIEADQVLEATDLHPPSVLL